jgi:DNAP
VEDRISALTTKDPNKLDVYIKGFDGHCLRAYAYFKDQMPDIELAQETEKCYSAKVGSSDICWKASDIINYQGKKYSGEEFYAMVTSKGI